MAKMIRASGPQSGAAPDRARVVIAPRKGLGHMLDAARYSLAGGQRLLNETAARQEIIGAALAACLLAAVGASALQWLGFALIFCALLATEALNTAIEVLTNRISPEWSEAAKQAKDLGSFAVAMMLLAAVGYVAAVAGLALWG